MIGENVNVKMAGFKYKEGESKAGKFYAGVFVSFKHDGQWLNIKPFFFPQEDGDKAEKQEKNVFDALDHISEIYLPSSIAKDLKIGNPTLRQYTEVLAEELQKVKFWERDVFLKTHPDQKGEPAVGFPPFLSHRPTMKYSDWEQKQVDEQNKSDNAPKQQKYNGGNSEAAKEVVDDMQLPF